MKTEAEIRADERRRVAREAGDAAMEWSHEFAEDGEFNEADLLVRLSKQLYALAGRPATEPGCECEGPNPGCPWCAVPDVLAEMRREIREEDAGAEIPRITGHKTPEQS